ncbi:MAG: hypothetical protein K5929_00070 [Lachnospiraceae bacterium]|nr:hypothetical protein [Lachnospiraceae bacterium]
MTAFDEDRTFLYEAQVHDRQQDDKAQGKGKAIDRITEAQQLFEVAVGKLDGSRPNEQGKIQDLRALTGEERDQSEEAFDRLFVKAYPDDFTNRWNEVKEDADALQKEYQEKYNAYGAGGFMNFVRAEGAGDAEKYQRLAQVIIAQVFSQPKNIKALQGIVAGQYDLMDTQNKILDYVTASRYLEGTNFNAERLEQDIATGRLRDKVLKNVVDKQKPAKLKKVLKNPHEMGMI